MPADSPSPPAGRSETRHPALLWVALTAVLGIAFALDGVVMSWVEPLRHSDLADIIHRTIRPIGTGYVQGSLALLMALAGAAFSRRLRRAGGAALLAFAASGLLVTVIKVLVHRPRPFTTAPRPDTWTGYLHTSAFHSFPSGETATTFAVALTICASYPALRLPLLALASLIGAARVLVGGHHPSDVIAGAMLGLTVSQLLSARSRRGGALAEKESDLPSARERHRALAVALGLLTALLFLGGLGRLPLFGRDEALYAEAARSMLAAGDWITPLVNGVHFFEKPPLNYWLASGSYVLFGVSPFAARLPAALAAILTIAVTALVTARVWGAAAGLLAGLALATSLQMTIIGRMGIMDVPLTCLVTLSMLAYARWRVRGDPGAAAAFGLLTGGAVLLKGLAGAIGPAIAATHLVVWRLRRAEPHTGRQQDRVTARSAALAVVLAVAVAAPWFIAMWLRHGDAFISEHFAQQHATRMIQPMQGHGGPVFYYLALIAVTFFPWVAFLPAALRPERGRGLSQQEALWRGLAITWILVVLVPFSLISTKLPGYVTPLFPPMAILVGVELSRRLREPGWAPWAGAAAGAVVLGCLSALLPLLGARLGAEVGASDEAWSLVLPTAFWVGGCGAILVGGITGAAGSPRSGLAFMVAGQLAVLGALLAGILPILSPYLGGAPAELAALAERELPGRRIVLYDTRSEAVAFTLQRTVPEYSHRQPDLVLAEIERHPVALIAPVTRREFWGGLPRRGLWRRGPNVLLDLLPADGEPPTPQATERAP